MVPEDVLAPLCYLAAPSVTLDPDRVRAAIRRALFVLAAGGDPHRDVAADGPAATSLARDLDDAAARGELDAALAALAGRAHGLPHVEHGLAELRRDPDTAWRWFAAALLADELSSE